MYHVMLLALVATLTYMSWQLVHTAPRSLSMFLPRKLSYGIGVTLICLGFFLAYFDAYAMRDPAGMLHCLIQVVAGMWWITAGSASMRGDYEDEQMLQRMYALMVFGFMGVVMAVYLAGDPRDLAIVNLALVTGSFWVTANFLQHLDRGH